LNELIVGRSGYGRLRESKVQQQETHAIWTLDKFWLSCSWQLHRPKLNFSIVPIS